jgi:hypothetical protein
LTESQASPFDIDTFTPSFQHNSTSPFTKNASLPSRWL